MIDIAPFLKPVSPTAPSGADLSRGELLNSIRTALQVREDRKIVTGEDGNRREEATLIEQDWGKILSMCEQALAQSKNLEVCIDYAAASVQQRGLQGAAAGLELIDGLIREFWDTFYPVLDPDDLDPGRRIGLIENLSAPPAPLTEDPIAFARRLSQAPLAKSRLGVLRLSDLKNGRVPPLDSEDAAPVFGAFAAMLGESTGAQWLEENCAALDRAVAAVKAIKASLAAKPGGRDPDMKLVEETLGRQKRVIELFATGAPSAAPSAAAESGESAEESPAAGAAAPAAAVAGGGARPSGAVGEIHGPPDVLRMIDKICAYYAKAEPSSPVPLLLQRARRLVGCSFMEVIGDLSAGSLDEIRKITGGPPPA